MDRLFAPEIADDLTIKEKYETEAGYVPYDFLLLSAGSWSVNRKVVCNPFPTDFYRVYTR